jgi:hypothetical protein
MQFLFLIRVDPDVELSDDEDPDVEPWLEEMEARGVRLTGNRLRPVEETKSVRVRSGDTLVSDGPFTEAKEVVAGFDLIDCADEAEALEIAAKHPVARFGAVEVRQLWPLEV